MATKKADAFTLATDLTNADLYIFAGSTGILYRITKANFHAALRLALMTPTDGLFRVNAAGDQLQLWNPTQSLYHSIWIEGAVGEEKIVIGAGEA